jgi:hypothetical protein
MYKIVAVSKINEIIVSAYPEREEDIIRQLLFKLACEMYSNKCLHIEKKQCVGEIIWSSPDEIEFKVSGLIMSYDEFNESLKLLHMIKSLLPYEHKYLADNLHKLITEAQ